jgi:hypothetical protein
MSATKFRFAGANVTVSTVAVGLLLGACAAKPKPSVYEPTDSRDEIKKVVQSHVPEVKGCYEAELKTTPDLQGKLTLSLTFDETGKVIDVGSTEMDAGFESMLACLAGRAREWRFPPAARGALVVVTYPFSFSK